MATFSGARIYSAAGTSISNATWTKVVHDTFDFGVTGMHDTTDDRFVATVEGYHKVMYGVGVTDDCNNDDVFTQLRINSTTASTSSGATVILSKRHAPAAGTQPIYRGQATVYMEVDDYLEVYIYVNRGAGSTMRTGTYVSLAAYLDVEEEYVGAGVKTTSNDTLTTSTPFIPTWDSESWDTDTFWASGADASKFIIPSSQQGVYRVDLTSGFNQGMGDSATTMWMLLNGTGHAACTEMPEANHWLWLSWSDIVEVVTSDYIQMQVQMAESSGTLWANSGGWSGTRMTMTKVGE